MMLYHFYLSSRNALPKHWALETEQLLVGEALAEAVWNGTDKRENFGFAFDYQIVSIYKNAALTGARVLVLDQYDSFQNVNRYDHYEENWTRLYLMEGESWKFVGVRNCADDYNTWVEAYYLDSRETAIPLRAGMEPYARVCRLEDGRIMEEALLKNLYKIDSVDAMAELKE